MSERNTQQLNSDSTAVRATLDSDEDAIDFAELFGTLWSNRRTIIKIACIPAIVTAIVTLIMKPTYIAEATFLPPNSMMANSTTALIGQISSLGSSGGGLGGLKDPTLIYVGMLGSNSVARELIMRYDLATVYGTKRLSQTEDALRKHTKIVSGKDSIVSISVEDHDPQRAANLANGYLTALSNISDRIAITDASQKRRFFEQQLEHEKNLLADAEGQLALSQQQTGLIQPGAQTQMEILTIAQTQADISSREIQLASMNQAATDQNPDVIRLRTEIASLKTQLNRLENASGQTRPGNIQVPTSKVPEIALIYARKARDVKYHEALYELLLRQYEAAKLDESKSAPLMQVIDLASVPDTKSGPKRTLLTLLAAVAGLVLGMAWSSIKFFRNNRAQRMHPVSS